MTDLIAVPRYEPIAVVILLCGHSREPSPYIGGWTKAGLPSGLFTCYAGCGYWPATDMLLWSP